MYNSLLSTFICVADSGSFNKAADKLFLSSTAIIKQINSLEEHLGLQLFSRTNHGIHLTPAGESIYKDSQFLLDFSKKSIEKARQSMENNRHIFSIGASLLNPAEPFMNLWYHINQRFPGYAVHLVTFDDNYHNILSEISQLGIKFDFLIGVSDSKRWFQYCNLLPLGRYKEMISVSKDHPLSKKKSIHMEDLYGETLMMVKKGDSDTNDTIRNDIKKKHPRIHIEDTPYFYDISVFNRCAESQNVLLTLECWANVHPGLVTIPVNWDYSIPYGLMYSLNPSQHVSNFIEVVKNTIPTLL